MADTNKLVQAINEFKKNLNGKTIPIHGKDYATVAMRVAFARRVLGTDLDIHTKIVSIDKETVVMEAELYIDGTHIATGHAEEKRAASRINQTSALENCETSAVGRALAFCGMISDGIASAEEVSAAIVQQDKKIQEALKELEALSHKGSYTEWLTKHKVMIEGLKTNNPPAYAQLLEGFKAAKNNLKTKGAI
tara:strand:- start:2106 stop:2684 length:579 start_codon:yes stop_codon:yes gene_type:complete